MHACKTSANNVRMEKLGSFAERIRGMVPIWQMHGYVMFYTFMFINCSHDMFYICNLFVFSYVLPVDDYLYVLHLKSYILIVIVSIAEHQ